jgi:pimeloyl-ACP methyl ester carboxylesterase
MPPPASDHDTDFGGDCPFGRSGWPPSVSFRTRAGTLVCGEASPLYLYTRETPQLIADRLPHLKVPARIVWGLADRFQKATYGQRQARDLRARAVGIPGGKHFTPEDHPDVHAAAIHELVDEVAR